MLTTYVFGHRNPDTDSVCSAISLSYLRNQLGEKCEPRVLGHITRESKFVLGYFGVKEPLYLNDVRIQIRNTNYHKKVMINEFKSINDTFGYMQINGISGVPIVDKSKKLLGIITLKEVLKEIIENNLSSLYTSYENIVNTLRGKEILKYNDEIIGKIVTDAFYSGTFTEKIELASDAILIVADRYKILDYAISSKVKLIILVSDVNLPKDLLKLAQKNQINVISTPLNTYDVISKIKLSSYIKTVKFNNSPVVFSQYDYREDFIEISHKHGHTNYPVINKKNECLGLIKVTNANDYVKRKVMLVDHNQLEQSVPGIEEAIIEGIVDHHNLGTIGTSVPINFRVMPVGCTCTVLYQLYDEADIVIPTEIAGLMLAAILSDTLLFKSPTTTNMDIDVAKKLAKICKIDIEKFGNEMFKAASSIDGLSPEEVFYQDFKSYKVDDDTLGISQIFTMDIDKVKEDLDKYVRLLDSIAYREYKVVVMFITDVIKNGSYIIYNTDSKNIIADAFEIENIDEGFYIADLVSRKKQMLPDIMEAMEKRG